MSESVAFYNPVGPEPPTYPLPPEEIAPGLYFADLFSLVNPAELHARGIYSIAATRNCEGSYPRDAECAYIDEPTTRSHVSGRSNREGDTKVPIYFIAPDVEETAGWV